MAELDRGRMRSMSAQVLRDCALGNGVILAANGEYQPPAAVSYHYTWARDTAAQLRAARVLGMPDASDIRSRYIGWVLRCAPGDDSSRLLLKRNQINGPNDWRYNDDLGFQPDNNGSLLAAIDATRLDPDPNDDRVMRLLANGLAAQWDRERQRFAMRVQDQWENTIVDPEEGTIFTHSLLAAANGLRRATASLRGYATDSEREVWEEVYSQMYDWFFAASEANTTGYYEKFLVPRSGFNQLDAGAALVVADLLSSDMPAQVQRLGVNTVRQIGRQLLSLPLGAYRYEGDTYDGIERFGGVETGAGAWPLLGYAWTRAARRVGMAQEAETAQLAMDGYLQGLYDRGVLPAYRVPEQLFPEGDPRTGQGPLHFGWGSAEWALADAARTAT